MLREAWGVYYGIWALTILLLLVLGGAALTLASSSVRGALGLLSFAIVVIAGLSTVRYFRGVWQRTHFPLWKVGRAFIGSFVLLIGGMVVWELLGGTLGLLALSLTVAATAILLALEQRWSMGAIPSEGWVAVAALLLGSLGSFGAWVATGSLVAYGSLWTLTVLLWGGCAGLAWTRGSSTGALPSPTRVP